MGGDKLIVNGPGGRRPQESLEGLNEFPKTMEGIWNLFLKFPNITQKQFLELLEKFGFKIKAKDYYDGPLAGQMPIEIRCFHKDAVIQHFGEELGKELIKLFVLIITESRIPEELKQLTRQPELLPGEASRTPSGLSIARK